MEMIDTSINNITERVKETYIGSNINIAIHEASHAVVAHQFPNYFKIGKLSLSNNGGNFLAKDTEFRFSPFEKVIAHIKVSMAGILGEKVICGTGSVGSESDLQDARKRAYNLFNISGYSSCWETLPTVSTFSRVETEYKRRRMERKIEKFLKSCEKDTIKIIKQNKDKIVLLANKLLERKRLKSVDILDCLTSSSVR
jgi:cell division protease FtsH